DADAIWGYRQRKRHRFGFKRDLFKAWLCCTVDTRLRSCICLANGRLHLRRGRRSPRGRAQRERPSRPLANWHIRNVPRVFVSSASSFLSPRVNLIIENTPSTKKHV